MTCMMQVLFGGSSLGFGFEDFNFLNFKLRNKLNLQRNLQIENGWRSKGGIPLNSTWSLLILKTHKAKYARVSLSHASKDGYGHG